MVSKVLASDKPVLKILDDSYLSATGESENVAKAELLPRYEKYYKAFEDGKKPQSILPLAFEMSQFFFPKHKPVLDLLLQAVIQSHVRTFMVSALELRKEYTIVDS
jgi:hypothetical protein